jgi:hypothetical protein
MSYKMCMSCFNYDHIERRSYVEFTASNPILNYIYEECKGRSNSIRLTSYNLIFTFSSMIKAKKFGKEVVNRVQRDFMGEYIGVKCYEE